jgi:hypothetical protein
LVAEAPVSRAGLVAVVQALQVRLAMPADRPISVLISKTEWARAICRQIVRLIQAVTRINRDRVDLAEAYA